MVERVTREQNNNITKFQVSETLCLAINNIDYVLKYIQPFVQVMISFKKKTSEEKLDDFLL